MSDGALNFGGSATLTLPGASSFSGGKVTGGTVVLNGTTPVSGGTTVIQATLANAGTIAASGGVLDLAGAVSGNGQIVVSNGATVELGQAAAASQRLSFADGSGVLRIDQPGLFKEPISGFQRGDVIDLAGVTATSASYAGGTLTLLNGSAPVAQLSLATPYTSPVFTLASD